LFIWPIIFVVLSLLIIYHFVVAICSKPHSWYAKEILLIGNNPIRWIGWAVIAGLVLPVLSGYVGGRNQNVIILISGLGVGEAILHLFAERALVQARRPLYKPDWMTVVVALVFGLALFAYLWAVLIRYYVRNKKDCAEDCKGRVPAWIATAFWTWFSVDIIIWILQIVLAAMPRACFYYYEIIFIILVWIAVLVFVIASIVGLSTNIKCTLQWLPFLKRCERCECNKKC
jgi:hypothetical protein